MTDIVIVGAGVIGLSAALAICESKLEVNSLTIVSHHDPELFDFSPEYTSAWAGAHFRPFPSKNAHEATEAAYARATLRRFKALAQLEPESLILFVTGKEYFENPDQFYRKVGLGYKEEITNFRVLDSLELPEGVVMGTEYDTYALNAPLYIQFLYRKLKIQYGVKFVHAKLESLKEATQFGPAGAIIVNCSGMGLQWNGGYDKDCFPIRGQTLLVLPPANTGLEKFTVTHQLKDNKWTFFIFRPSHGGCIVGGTKQPHDTFPGVRDSDTAELKERAAKLYPQLMKTNSKGEKYFDVVRVNVGFRPARKGGMNVSRERHDGVTVVNGYGAGGSGYEFSYGVGKKIVELLRSRPKL
ncbi:hypothetical protein PUMCH_000952 [Australozyma saopauloensis]|uniref:FAD dependent oxidoreductase domain-containing protein n=1 Tax=Australozyma saopauloensis TaxID=291208 RepID=A0AAX4H564_9ASCO|nr:hypothetical protein PUMCH_000952 [[Candida] saopauloensis]